MIVRISPISPLRFSLAACVLRLESAGATFGGRFAESSGPFLALFRLCLVPSGGLAALSTQGPFGAAGMETNSLNGSVPPASFWCLL